MNPEEARMEKALAEAPPEWIVGVFAQILTDEKQDPRGLADCAWTRVMRPRVDMPSVEVACLDCRRPLTFNEPLLPEKAVFAPLLTMRIFSLNGPPEIVQEFLEKMGPSTFYLGRCPKCRKVFWAW